MFQFSPAALELEAFGSSADTGGWQSDDRYPRILADVNGDGRADLLGFGEVGVYVAFGNADGSFAPSFLASSEFGFEAVAGGWISNDKYPRWSADVNGDGFADIVGFGDAGVYVALGHGDGTFDRSYPAIAEWGSSAASGGWRSYDRHPRELADVNGDGRADIVGFGEAGTYVSLANADGTFAGAFLAAAQFGAAWRSLDDRYGDGIGGWGSQEFEPRLLSDVNGDGRADIVAFGRRGVYVMMGQPDGTFEGRKSASLEWGEEPQAGSWTSNLYYPRELADVNGDGKIDIVGFNVAGVYVSLGKGDGTFAPSTHDINGFGSAGIAGSWTSQENFPRLLGDVNGDGAADIVGLGNAGAYVALSNAHM